eukprot:TRINITY_DN82176_c0_g1_i1.p3 TRINITY_DN82176_c0_g1~~TRINITY_DN82176_c0_g1_i1.p3  ORF type:complete len:105 (+),score=1.82 TRINITY_DN82176_c0_g1_i1:294-608(+)
MIHNFCICIELLQFIIAQVLSFGVNMLFVKRNFLFQLGDEIKYSVYLCCLLDYWFVVIFDIWQLYGVTFSQVNNLKRLQYYQQQIGGDIFSIGKCDIGHYYKIE